MSFPRMHVSLYVKNIYQTADFYTKFFGQNPDKIKPDYCKFTLNEPSLIISFVQNEEKVSSHFGHLGFQIESLEELKTRMDEMNLHNITMLEEMGTNCCYAHQDKFWVTDPNGYMWEVYYFHEDVAFNDPRYATQDASACCTPEKPIAKKQKIKLADLPHNSCAPESGCC